MAYLEGKAGEKSQQARLTRQHKLTFRVGGKVFRSFFIINLPIPLCQAPQSTAMERRADTLCSRGTFAWVVLRNLAPPIGNLGGVGSSA